MGIPHHSPEQAWLSRRETEGAFQTWARVPAVPAAVMEPARAEQSPRDTQCSLQEEAGQGLLSYCDAKPAARGAHEHSTLLRAPRSAGEMPTWAGLGSVMGSSKLSAQLVSNPGRICWKLIQVVGRIQFIVAAGLRPSLGWSHMGMCVPNMTSLKTTLIDSTPHLPEPSLLPPLGKSPMELIQT